MKATAKAHTNIALIKYWGKRDETLILPMNNSLSLTLDQFYTTTTVEFNKNLENDRFILNGQMADKKETEKISRYMDVIRACSNTELYATIRSVNHVPTAAGFASSASGYAALAAAATKALGLDLDSVELSKLARRGSGSASRSIFGGFVEWLKGEKDDGSDSYAVQILNEKEWKLSVISVMVESKKKKISSRDGMKRTVETSPFYQGWLDSVTEDLQLAKQAIRMRDFELLGRAVEKNAIKMHATTLGADPPFFYWQKETFEIITLVHEMREQNIPAYFTIDAGPNVKVLCLPQDEQTVYNKLSEHPAAKEVIISHPGPGVTYLPES